MLRKGWGVEIRFDKGEIRTFLNVQESSVCLKMESAFTGVLGCETLSFGRCEESTLREMRLNSTDLFGNLSSR